MAGAGARNPERPKKAVGRMKRRTHWLKRWAEKLRNNAVVRSGSAAGTIKAVGLVIAFVLQMLLARLVSDPAQFGIYAWGQNMLFLLGSLFALGIPLATSRLVAVHHNRGDQASVTTLRHSGARWLALICLTGTVIAMIIVFALPSSVFGDLPRIVALLAAGASSLVAFTQFHQAMARARSRLASAFLPTQVLRPLFTGLIALGWFAWAGRNPGGVEILIVVCLSLLLVLVIQLFLVNRRQPASADVEPDHDELRRDSYGPSRIMPNALPIFATRLADLFVQYGNVFVLGVLGGPLAAAGFFVAERLSRLASVPRSVISSVVQPWLASAHAQDDRRGLQETVRHAGHATLWPTLVSVVILLIAGSFLLSLFGSGYQSAYPVLTILLASHLLGAALGPAQQVLIMSGHQSLVMKVMTLAAGVHIIALLVLIPWLGMIGAAIANLVSTSVARTGCVYLVRTRLDLDPSVIAPLFTKWSTKRKDEDD